MSLGKNSFDWKQALSIQNEFLTDSFDENSLKEVLTKLTDRLDELDSDHAVTILLMSNEGLIPSAGSRIPKEWKEQITPLPLGKNMGSCGTAGFLKKRVIVENILEDPLWADFKEYQPLHGFSACWSQPVINATGDLLGTFAIYFKKPRTPDKDELELIELLSNTVSIILQRRQMEQQLIEKIKITEHLSRIDELTGLNNRRSFFEKGEYIFELSKRYNKNFSILFIDLDRFKQINDTFGHATGDSILKTVSRSITDTIRDVDIAARLGGDEFSVILPETSETCAIELAERIRKRTESLEIIVPSGILQITVSIGVGSTSRADKANLKEFKDLLEASDKALYLAKTEGNRNCVVSS